MIKKTASLRKQFLTRIFIILLIIVLFTGIIQIFFIKKQIDTYLQEQSQMLSHSIEHGIKASDLAGQSIEHQIDLKLLSYAYHIGDLLKGKKWEDITNEELIKIKEKLNITGITILAEQGDDIVGVKSTDPNEIGFSFKKIGYMEGYTSMKERLNGKTPNQQISYAEKNAHVIPIAQSGSHDNKPSFFKYAYYVIPGTNYIIDPYIEANEIYQYTTEVGPQTWIQKVIAENPYLIEIAIVNPLVFKNPDWETKLYPPKKKILYGKADYLDERDNNLLLNMADQTGELTNINYVNSAQDKKLYKMFIPIDKERVIYAALDYEKIISPLYRHSVILIISGIASVMALFLFTARFFNRIYENIQKIKQQIKALESSDFTAKSSVNDGNELGDLSKSANRMVETLHSVLVDTSEQASKVQWMSIVLQNDANESVEKMYTVSMETTMKQREVVEEILSFLDDVEKQLKMSATNQQVNELLEKVEVMRESAKERAAITTDFTITLSDLLTSLHDQSKELADISNTLLQNIQTFKL